MAFQLAPAIFLRGYNSNNTQSYYSLSDHSRAPFNIGYERYEKSVQLADGTTRKYVISSKRSLSINWSNLPTTSEMTVDYGMGARDLQSFYERNYNNEIIVYIFIDQGTGTPLSSGISLLPNDGGLVGTMPSTISNAVSYTAYIDSFSCTVNKRYLGGGTPVTGRYDLWDASLSLKEV